MDKKNEIIQRLRQIIRDANSIVAFCGEEMVTASGYTDLECDEAFYDLETKYNASASELYSSRCYNTRPEKFFEFYQNEILVEASVSQGYYALAELERRGKIRAVITKDVHGLPQKAGCSRVLEQFGTIYQNECKKCKKQYSIEYVRSTDKVPRCDMCNGVVRPGIILPGEMVQNHIMTQMVEVISRADVMLLLGVSEPFYLYEKLLQYYEGDKLIDIRKNNSEPHPGVNIIVNAGVDEILPEIII